MDPNAEAAAIAAIVAGADTDARTYDHQKLPKNSWDAFLEAFTVEVAGVRRVHAITVEYLGETRTPMVIALGNRKIKREVDWIVRLFLSWDDAGDSETTFRSLLVALTTALDSDPAKGGAYLDSDPVDVSVPNNGAGIALGDFLCHYGELTFTAWREENIATTSAP